MVPNSRRATRFCLTKIGQIWTNTVAIRLTRFDSGGILTEYFLGTTFDLDLELTVDPVRIDGSSQFSSRVWILD